MFEIQFLFTQNIKIKNKTRESRRERIKSFKSICKDSSLKMLENA